MATDTQSDMHMPLLPRIKSIAWMALLQRVVFWFNRLGGGLLGLVALGLGVWLFLIDDRLGGEPQATTPIRIADMPSQSGGEIADPAALPPPVPVAGAPRVIQVPRVADADSMQQDMPPLPDSQLVNVSPTFDTRGGLPEIANPSLVNRFDTSSFVPARGPNGERALDAYARPVEAGTLADGQPRIAIIVSGLGLSQTATQSVIDRLPGEMTLSFAPYGNSLSRWTSRARQAGHEYLIEVPMEPFDYPNNDPGPHTLLASHDVQANLERMQWALSRVPTPVGVMNYMGGRFTSEEQLVRPIVADAVARGLMVVDDGRSARSRVSVVAQENAPVLRADVIVDARTDEQSMTNRLTQLEALARENGEAVGVASALPLTITMLEDWAASLRAKGIVLVPVSSIVRF
ncbi:MAG: divergent polysaccharide deacetylase family protein [Hyphomicrobiales bacterium]